MILIRDIRGQRSLSRDFCSCPCPRTKGHRDKIFFVPQDVPSLGNASMYLNFSGSNQTKFNLSNVNKIESPHGIMGKNLHPINSAPPNLKTEVILYCTQTKFMTVCVNFVRLALISEHMLHLRMLYVYFSLDMHFIHKVVKARFIILGMIYFLIYSL